MAVLMPPAAGNSAGAAQIAQAAQASGNTTVIAAASLATGETGSNSLTQNTQICGIR